MLYGEIVLAFVGQRCSACGLGNSVLGDRRTLRYENQQDQEHENN
jgi:hypothetical protein